MLNDFIPIINSLRLEDHPHGVTIIPLADAHYGSPQFNETRWHETIKRIQDDPHCFAVTVGDLMDNTLKSSVGSVYENSVPPSVQKEWLYNELLPIKDRLLASCGGNHEARSVREIDSDPMYDVMLRLGREEVYRQNICFMLLRITYPFKGKEKQRHSFTFAITHGNGGGMYIGSSANRVQTYGMALEGVECLVTGHTHKPLTFPVAKIVFNSGAVVKRQFVVAVASSFLDYGGYPVRKLMPPTAQTTTEITLNYFSDGKKKIKVTQD